MTLDVLWLIVPAGALGGIVQCLWSIVQAHEVEKRTASFRDIPPLSLLTRALVGGGGAVGVTLLLFAIGKFPKEPWAEQLYLASLSFVAGFIGHRVLPIVAARLEQQVAEAKADVAQMQGRVEEIDKSRPLEETLDAILGDLLREQVQRAASPAFTLRPDAIRGYIDQLERFRKDWPRHRKLHIVLGRLYKWQQNYDEATKVLSEFIDAKRAAGDGADLHVADALFNRACYKSLKSQGREGAEAEALRADALKDLAASIAINPSNRATASGDPDLLPLHNVKGFGSITGSAAET